MKTVDELSVKVFADGADMAGILEMYRLPHIKGFTTNPTLMKKAGIADYSKFAKQVLEAIPDRPISFEVFSRVELFCDLQLKHQSLLCLRKYRI